MPETSAVIELSADLSLPADAVTQTFGILARRGAGKTYTGRKITEGLIKAGMPVCVLDPLGAWWGLRSSADGQSDGLPVTILGGDHGDVPLEETAGKVVADLMVEHPASYVLDLSHFDSNAAQDRFARDFAERLYRAKAHHREPLHLMVDEADSFAPQRPQRGQEAMLGAYEAISRRGRIRGLGCTLITQRPAVLNKNVLTQIECLIAMQVTSPQDRKALEEWVRGNADRDEASTVLDSLASLEVGEAWVWSPQWLRTLQRIKVARCETFDSSSTPEHGETLEPARMAPVDLDALRDRMASTIEKVKADDPKELKRQIKALRKELDEARSAQPEPEVVTVEVPMLDAGLVARLEEALAPVSGAVETIEKATFAVTQRLADARQLDTPPARVRPTPAPVQRRPPAARATIPDDGTLPKAEKALLAVLAQRSDQGATKIQLSILSGYSSKSSGFANSLSSLRSKGYIVGSNKDVMRITDQGLDAIGDDFDPLPPSGADLLAYWTGNLGKCEGECLSVLVTAYPDALDKDQVAEATPSGYSVTSSGFANALSKLRSLGLIEGSNASMVANEELVG